jgi:hypothetical protein
MVIQNNSIDAIKSFLLSHENIDAGLIDLMQFGNQMMVRSLF